MNTVHLHLILNHIPVLGTVFGLVLLLFGLWRRSEELKKAALGTFVIVALLGVPAYLTGEPAEEGVKSLPGVMGNIIEQHEEAASVAFTCSVVLGIASLGGLLAFRRGKAVPAWFSAIMVAAAVIVSSVMSWTANLGGQVRHTEIRAGVPASMGNEKNHD